MNKFRKYFKLKHEHRKLLNEALYWSYRAWFKTTFLSLKNYYSWLGSRVEAIDYTSDQHLSFSDKQIEDIKNAIRRSIKYSPWKTTCLTQAITTKKILSKRGISSYLFLSVKKEGVSLSAHAWVKVNKDIVFGKELKKYEKEIFIYK